MQEPEDLETCCELRSSVQHRDISRLDELVSELCIIQYRFDLFFFGPFLLLYFVISLICSLDSIWGLKIIYVKELMYISLSPADTFPLSMTIK